MKTLTIMEKALFKIVEGASSKGKTPKYKRALKLKWRRHQLNGGVTIIRRTLNLVKGGHNMETSTIFGGAIKIIEERWH